MPRRGTPLGVSANADPNREALAREFCIEAARMLSDDKCEDVMVLDLRGRSQMTDFFIIASGTSDRQLRSAADHVAQSAKKCGIGVYRSNLDEARANWILVDLVDIVVHVLMPDTRRYYDLEMLWGDAPRISWQRDSDKAEAAAAQRATERNRAGLTPGDILPGGRRG
jgi:ribosome-associated protein